MPTRGKFVFRDDDNGVVAVAGLLERDGILAGRQQDEGRQANPAPRRPNGRVNEEEVDATPDNQIELTGAGGEMVSGFDV